MIEKSTLKSIRLEKGFTTGYVAKHCEINKHYFSQIESGNKKLSLRVAKKLSEIYNLTLDEIVESYTILRNKKINKG